jgi:hypothetical protein
MTRFVRTLVLVTMAAATATAADKNSRVTLVEFGCV